MKTQQHHQDGLALMLTTKMALLLALYQILPTTIKIVYNLTLMLLLMASNSLANHFNSDTMIFTSKELNQVLGPQKVELL